MAGIVQVAGDKDEKAFLSEKSTSPKSYETAKHNCGNEERVLWPAGPREGQVGRGLDF